jgi:hypothetical protein
MLSPEARRRALEIALFVLPIVLVQMSGMVLGTGGPTEADAAEETPDAPPAQVSVREPIVWTDEQLAAGRRVRELAAQPFVGTPMHFKIKPVAAPDRTPDEPKYNPLQVKLNGIMKSSLGHVALVDERAYTVGDVVAQDWEITAISSEARSVTFRHGETGETVTLVLPTAGE